MMKFVFIIAGILGGIIFLETSLRIYYFLAEKQLFGLKPARITLRFYDHDIFGSALLPNQQGWFVSSNREYFTWVETNSGGWPDQEHNLAKDSLRILLLGDSFVENLQVGLERRFFRQWEQSLAKDGEEVEVIAMGRGNTGTAQQLLILKNLGLPYQPDIVVQFFLTANDVKNNSPLLQNDPYLPYFRINQHGELELIPHRKRSERKLSALKEFFKQTRVMELILAARQKILEEKTSLAFSYPLDYHIYDNVYGREYEEAWAVTKKLIVETKLATEKTGARYVLISLTNNEQVNSDVWQRLLKTYPLMKQGSLDLDKPDKILAGFCQEEKIDCFFMLPYFREFTKNNPHFKTHYPLDGHWTTAGTDLAAKFLWQYQNLILWPPTNP